MRKYFVITFICTGLIALWPGSGLGQGTAPDFEVFFGGSKLWEHVSGSPYRGLYHNHGLRFAATGNFNRYLGLELDLEKFPNSPIAPPAYGDYFRFLAGPHFAYNGNSRLSPFAHVLAGLTNGRACPPTSSCFLTSDEVGKTAFTADVGGGLDVKVFRFVWVRPIQVDYVHVFLPNAPENNLQLSFGVTFRFGSIGNAGNRSSPDSDRKWPPISQAIPPKPALTA
jgi:hypothetical protein